MDSREDEDSPPSVSPRIEGATAGLGSFAERAKYIPLRLSPTERRMLRLLEAALSVSEYTDKARPKTLGVAWVANVHLQTMALTPPDRPPVQKVQAPQLKLSGLLLTLLR